MAEESWSNRYDVESPTVSIKELERIVAEIGPPRRATLRYHPLDRLWVEDTFLKSTCDPGNLPEGVTPLDSLRRFLSLPLKESEYIPRGKALLHKEVQRGKIWETEAMEVFMLYEAPE